MEKLRPIFRQIFWISTGLAIVLIVLGWWLGTNNLIEQYNKDKATLDTAIKDSKDGGNRENDDWIEAVRKINATDKENYDLAAIDLYDRQIQVRTYPESIADDLKQFSFGSKITNPALRYRYGQLYEDHFLDQVREIDPFIVEEARGLIQVNLAGITKQDATQWLRRRPTSSEIWKAQEDLWLLRSMFRSIATVFRQMMFRSVDRTSSSIGVPSP